MCQFRNMSQCPVSLQKMRGTQTFIKTFEQMVDVDIILNIFINTDSILICSNTKQALMRGE